MVFSLQIWYRVLPKICRSYPLKYGHSDLNVKFFDTCILTFDTAHGSFNSTSRYSTELPIQIQLIRNKDASLTIIKKTTCSQKTLWELLSVKSDCILSKKSEFYFPRHFTPKVSRILGSKSTLVTLVKYVGVFTNQKVDFLTMAFLRSTLE